MKLTKIALLIFSPTVALVLGACSTGSRLETETTTSSSSSVRSKTRVVKDEIPAEGQRKIPVIEEY